MATHADCTPVICWIVHRAIGLCHAGWRSTVGGGHKPDP
ncbi:MAG: laccase domain-containing protein [Christensenellales bacterium]